MLILIQNICTLFTRKITYRFSYVALIDIQCMRDFYTTKYITYIQTLHFSDFSEQIICFVLVYFLFSIFFIFIVVFGHDSFTLRSSGNTVEEFLVSTKCFQRGKL